MTERSSGLADSLIAFSPSPPLTTQWLLYLRLMLHNGSVRVTERCMQERLIFSSLTYFTFTWPQSSLCHSNNMHFFFLYIITHTDLVSELWGMFSECSIQQHQQLEKLLWLFAAADRCAPDAFVPVWISSVWPGVSRLSPHRPFVATLLHFHALTVEILGVDQPPFVLLFLLDQFRLCWELN